MERRKKREHFVTCGQMKLLERRADEDGLSYYQMMENAGTGAAQIIMERAAARRMPQEILKVETAGTFHDAKVAEPLFAQLKDSSGTTGSAEESEFPKSAGDYSSAKDSNTAGMNSETLRNQGLSSNDDLNKNNKSSLHRSAVLFCGKGNNGGDGFVAARIFANSGYRVTVILVDGEPKTPDAITNFQLLADLPVEVIDLKKTDSTAEGTEEPPYGERAFRSAGGLTAFLREKSPDMIVDAIYGTGFHGTLQDNARIVAEALHYYVEQEPDAETRGLVCALDIPSGLSGDALKPSQIDENAVKADCTLTFHARKPVHLQKFAKPYCGEIIAIDIGIDEERLWGN